jgi:hypothetical protein
MNINQKPFRLLKPGNRWIGVLFILLPFIGILVFRLIAPKILRDHASLGEILTLESICIGLFIFCICAETVEDEMTTQMRFKAMSATFLLTVFFILAQPIVDAIWPDDVHNRSEFRIAIGMLICYLLLFYVFKRATNEKQS